MQDIGDKLPIFHTILTAPCNPSFQIQQPPHNPKVENQYVSIASYHKHSPQLTRNMLGCGVLHVATVAKMRIMHHIPMKGEVFPKNSQNACESLPIVLHQSDNSATTAYAPGTTPAMLASAPLPLAVSLRKEKEHAQGIWRRRNKACMPPCSLKSALIK